MNRKDGAITIVILALIITGILFSFTPILRSHNQTKETFTITWIETTTITLIKTVSYETYGPKDSIKNLEGAVPADIKKVAFSRNHDTLSIILEVQYPEGFAEPYAYGVFLSNNSDHDKGSYCILFLPWPQTVPKVLLVDLMDYSHVTYEVEIKNATAEAHIPLESLENISPYKEDFTFYAWSSSWAHDFVPVNMIDDRENVWLFDDLPISQISFSSIKHIATSIQSSATISKSTQFKTVIRVSQQPSYRLWHDVLAPGIPWALAAAFIVILWRKR